MAGNQAMNFVEKKYFALFERSEDRGQVALAFEQRAGTGFDDHAQFAGDNLRERRLAKPRRAVEQHVIERFAAAARRLDGDLDVFLHARLADVIGEAFRANARVNARVFIQRRAGNDALRGLFHSRLASCSGSHRLTSDASAPDLEYSRSRFIALASASFLRYGLVLNLLQLVAAALSGRTQLLQRAAQQILKCFGAPFLPARSTACSAACWS